MLRVRDGVRRLHRRVKYSSFAERARAHFARRQIEGPLMQQPSVAVPGARISDYRNSEPRAVRLYGLGERGATIVRDIGRNTGANVAVGSGNRSVGWSDIAGGADDAGVNLIVIVCGEGDQILFDGDDDKPDSLVTFVVLQKTSNALVVTDEKFARARNRCDLFVTTSDTDYVGELIDNLAS
jgi:hypothetical protein